MESEIEITNSSRITEQVKNLNKDISSLDEIKKLAGDIEGALKKAVGHTYGPNVASCRSNLIPWRGYSNAFVS